MGSACHIYDGTAWALCGYSPGQVLTLHAVAASLAKPVAGRTIVHVSGTVPKWERP